MFLVVVVTAAVLIGFILITVPRLAAVSTSSRSGRRHYTYKMIASLLSGMNRRHIDWGTAQRLVVMDGSTTRDPVLMALKALLLHPGVFQSDDLEKDEEESILAWNLAEELGLSAQANAGNPWAQWLQGMCMGLVERNIQGTMHLFQLAADQGFALSQNSLGVVYQEAGQLDVAMEYYQLAAEQGQADAQYNIAMLYCADFELMRPRLEQAAAQGHAQALFYLARQNWEMLVLQHEEFARAIVIGNAGIQIGEEMIQQPGGRNRELDRASRANVSSSKEKRVLLLVEKMMLILALFVLSETTSIAGGLYNFSNVEDKVEYEAFSCQDSQGSRMYSHVASPKPLPVACVSTAESDGPIVAPASSSTSVLAPESEEPDCSLPSSLPSSDPSSVPSSLPALSLAPAQSVVSDEPLKPVWQVLLQCVDFYLAISNASTHMAGNVLLTVYQLATNRDRDMVRFSLGHGFHMHWSKPIRMFQGAFGRRNYLSIL